MALARRDGEISQLECQHVNLNSDFPKPSQNITETRTLASLHHADLFLLAQFSVDCPRELTGFVSAALLRTGPPNLHL